MSATLPRAVHPAAWWGWAVGMAVAVSTTNNPLLLLLALAVVALVVANRRGLVAVGARVPALPVARPAHRRGAGRAARARRAQVRRHRAVHAARGDPAVVGGRHPARWHGLPRGAARRGRARPAAGGDHRLHRRRQRPGQPQAAAAVVARRRCTRSARPSWSSVSRRAAAGRERAAGAPGAAAARRHARAASASVPSRGAAGARGRPRALAAAGRRHGLARLRPRRRRAAVAPSADRRRSCSSGCSALRSASTGCSTPPPRRCWAARAAARAWRCRRAGLCARRPAVGAQPLPARPWRAAEWLTVGCGVAAAAALVTVARTSTRRPG